MFRFGVTVDGQFLPKPAAELLQSHQFNKVPLINGITNDECGYMLPNVKTDLLRFVFPKIRTSILQYIHIQLFFHSSFHLQDGQMGWT